MVKGDFDYAPGDAAMDTQAQLAADQEAFRRLEGEIAKQFPRGRFVAIFAGRAIADAASFEEILAALADQRKDPGQVLVVQAGFDYPETAVIFTHAGQA
jgi:hypothetical protein